MCFDQLVWNRVVVTTPPCVSLLRRFSTASAVRTSLSVSNKMSEIFKDKEELQEYLKNLGIEYRFSCYEEKNPEGEDIICLLIVSSLTSNHLLTGCNLLGQFLSVFENDYAKGYNVFKHSCDTYNYGKSCNELGIMKLSAYGTKQDVAGAVASFKKSCDQGHADGCFHLGQMISGADGEFTRKNKIQTEPETGLKLLEKACDLGCADACFSAHSYLIEGIPGIAKNMTRAFALAKKGCDSGYHFESCENLMIMYQKGIGTEKNPTEAEKVKEKVDHYRDALLKQREMNLQRTER